MTAVAEGGGGGGGLVKGSLNRDGPIADIGAACKGFGRRCRGYTAVVVAAVVVIVGGALLVCFSGRSFQVEKAETCSTLLL